MPDPGDEYDSDEFVDRDPYKVAADLGLVVRLPAAQPLSEERKEAHRRMTGGSRT